MTVKERIYGLLDKHRIKYPDGHDLIILARQKYILYTDIESCWSNDATEYIVFLGYNGVATTIMNICDRVITIQIGWLTHRWTYVENQVPKHQAFLSSDHGVKEWNEWVTKQSNINILKNKL